MTFGPSDHTFVLCAYKESPFLEECLQSLLAQTVKTNVLIATSTPCDATRELAKRTPLSCTFGMEILGSLMMELRSKLLLTLLFVTVAHQDDTYEPEYAAHLLTAANKMDNLLIFFTNYGELRNGAKVDDNQLLRIKRLMLTPVRDGRFATSRWMRRRILVLRICNLLPVRNVEYEQVA